MIRTINIATIRAVYAPFNNKTSEQSVRRGDQHHVPERIQIRKSEYHDWVNYYIIGKCPGTNLITRTVVTFDPALVNTSFIEGLVLQNTYCAINA